MKGRASNNKIVVVSNSMAGSNLQKIPRNNKDCVVWDNATQQYVHEPRALIDHDHEIGNMVVLFENQLI